MALQADPTVQYAILLATGRRKTRLFDKDYQIKSPYNTYLHPGLPPGPVNSPGRRSIEAALLSRRGAVPVLRRRPGRAARLRPDLRRAPAGDRAGPAGRVTRRGVRSRPPSPRELNGRSEASSRGARWTRRERQCAFRSLRDLRDRSARLGSFAQKRGRRVQASAYREAASRMATSRLATLPSAAEDSRDDRDAGPAGPMH